MSDNKEGETTTVKRACFGGGGSRLVRMSMS